MTEHNRNEETEISFWRKLFTSKSATATAPISQPTSIFGTEANAEEFMQSMIEANKAIPRQNELIEKLLESQTRSNESIAKLGTDLEELKLKLSEPQQDTDPKPQEGNNGEDNDPQQKQQGTPSTGDGDQDPKPPKQPEHEPQHTAKTSKPFIPTTQYQDQYEEDAMKFIANRSYEKLIGGQ